MTAVLSASRCLADGSGIAAASRLMNQSIDEAGATVDLLPMERPRRVMRHLLGGGASHAQTLYSTPGAGRGALLDLAVVRGWPKTKHLYFHHHSCRYLERPSRTHRALFSAETDRPSVHIALSPYMKEMLCDAYGLTPTSVEVVDNLAVAGSVFHEESRGRAALNDDGPIRLGFVGLLTESKGLDQTLIAYREAVARLRKASVFTELHIAGSKASDTDAILRRHERTISGQDVSLRGLLDRTELHELLETLDVLLFPTVYPAEAQPIVLYESMLAGLRIYTNDHALIREQVEGYPNAVLASPRWTTEDLVDRVVSDCVDLSFADRRAQARIVALAALDASRQRWLSLARTIATA